MLLTSSGWFVVMDTGNVCCGWWAEVAKTPGKQKQKILSAQSSSPWPMNQWYENKLTFSCYRLILISHTLDFSQKSPINTKMLVSLTSLIKKLFTATITKVWQKTNKQKNIQSTAKITATLNNFAFCFATSCFTTFFGSRNNVDYMIYIWNKNNEKPVASDCKPDSNSWWTIFKPPHGLYPC